MSKSLIIGVRAQYRLFRQPNKIGDTLDVQGEPMLIISIENFKILHDRISVSYTCQRLTVLDFVSKRKAYSDTSTLEMEATLRHDKWDKVGQLALGKITWYQGEAYKVLEYTEVSLKSTDLYISLIARLIYRIDRKEAKAKLFSERRKKLKWEVL